jgi:hypothetical protein
MLRAISVLAVAGLVAVALSAWMFYGHVVDVGAQGDIVSYLPQAAFTTGNALSFAAGVLTLTLAIPRRQRPWLAALLASLILNTYWSVAFGAIWWTLRRLSPAGVQMSSSSSPYLLVLVIDVISSGIAPAAPALLALGYTIHAARSVSQAPLAVVEQEGLDITVEPMGSEMR